MSSCNEKNNKNYKQLDHKNITTSESMEKSHWWH